jgi:hypothetical protein
VCSKISDNQESSDLVALANLIKTQKLTGYNDEFYDPLCDVLLDIVELDIDGARAFKFSQIAHSLAHDFLNLAMLAGRLIWYEGATPDMSRSPDLVAIAVDTETYLISLRTACDIVAEAFSYFCVEPQKRGQLPKKKQSFRAMICWQTIILTDCAMIFDLSLSILIGSWRCELCETK